MFNCDKCGECCRHIREIDALKHLDTGNGLCRFLKNNLCSIYDNRPDICNVEKMYESFKDIMSKNEYYELNYQGCIELRKNMSI